MLPIKKIPRSSGTGVGKINLLNDTKLFNNIGNGERREEGYVSSEEMTTCDFDKNKIKRTVDENNIL